MKTNSRERYWHERAKVYQNLEWVRNKSYLKNVISAIVPNLQDIVLDIGTGTGAIAVAISPMVNKVIGVDFSQSMLDRAKRCDNIYYVKWDVREPLFYDGIFTKVVARQVLHHIPETQVVVDICHRVLKKGGKFIIAEPVCPSPDIKDRYGEIFKLKDNRQIFTEEDLIEIIKKAGFESVKATTFRVKKFSVRNWLDNNALESVAQNKIFELHVRGSDAFRRAYRMKIINGDCLIDIKNVVIVGEK